MRLVQASLAAALLVLVGACSPQNTKPAAAPPAPVTGEVQPAPAPQVADQGPLTVGGLYITKDACPGEGCYLSGKIRAYEAADLYDKAGAGAVVTGKVAAGEWVEIVTAEDHVFPLRGVVREGRKNFATGDVVYLLSSEGEGCYATWSKGALGSWCDPDSDDPKINEPIDFDAPSPKPDGAGLWVKVKTAKGAEGWLRGARDFACTGYQDRDADCPPLLK